MIFFFGFMFLYSFFFLPMFGFQAEMFAENATNYFNTAHLLPFSQGILVTDYGYLPLLPRLFASLVEWIGIAPKNVPVAYDLIACFVVALCIISFVSNWGARVIRRPLLRYVFAFLIFMLPDYELKSFINFSYWLFVPIFLLVLKSWEDPDSFSRRGWLGFVLLICLAILSKPLFFVIVPILFILGLKMIRQRRFLWRALLLCLVPLSALVQIKISQASHPLEAQSFHFQSILYGLFYVPIAVVEKIFGHIIVHNSSRFVLFAIGLGFGLFFLWQVLKRTSLKERRELLIVFIFSSLIIYFNAFICLRSYTHYYIDIAQLNLRPVMSLLSVRHWFFANLAAYFVILKCYDVFPRVFSKSRIFFLLLLLFAGKHFSFPTHQIKYDPYSHGNSDWEASLRTYGDPKAADSFCIPINPMSWFYKKRCKIDGDLEELKRLFQTDDRKWSAPIVKYNFELASSAGPQMHWLAFHSRFLLSGEDLVSVKIDGREVPIRIFSEKTELTYVWLSRLPMQSNVEVTFRQPVELEIGAQKQVLKIIAGQGEPIP